MIRKYTKRFATLKEDRRRGEARISTRKTNLRNISSQLRYTFDSLCEEENILPGYERLEELSGFYGKFINDECYIVIDTDPNGDSVVLHLALVKEEEEEDNESIAWDSQYDLEIHITDPSNKEEIELSVQILEYAAKLILKKWKEKGVI